ncbi:MAG: hypothetical protein ACXVO9_01165 [Bacteroidia bacterium]
MIKNAIIALLSCYCIFVYSQPEIHFTKAFEAGKKNIALGIINNHPNYFHVLRYNKAAHDITIERRDKPNGHIIAFTPLKLDSVNSSLFNYENLDYLWYEVDNKLYFVFEKVLNTKRTIYLKIIDTLGKSSGFIELSSLQAENGAAINFMFSKGGNENSVLVIGSMAYPNGITKKTALLFNTKTLKPEWIKKLPHEVTMAELTDDFMTNEENDLFYVHYKIRAVEVAHEIPSIYSSLNPGMQRKLRTAGYVNEPSIIKEEVINGFDKISLIKSFSASKEIIAHDLGLKNIDAVSSATLLPLGEDVIFTAHVVENDFGPKPYLHIERLNSTLNKIIFIQKHEFSAPIIQQLTFYDGTDYKDPAYKHYGLRKSLIADNQLIYVSERKDENYYKELLSWRLNNETGELLKLEVIPRKIFYFNGRTRYKKMGECMMSFKNDTMNFYVLEDPDNIKKASASFNYHNFDQQENLWGANVIRYNSAMQGPTNKQNIYTNKNYDLIPLFYESSYQKDELFYFNEGTYEKFGFISLDQKK